MQFDILIFEDNNLQYTNVRILYVYYIHFILGGKKNGFYIETGAYDGEIYSNSLLFELKRNYTGMFCSCT